MLERAEGIQKLKDILQKRSSDISDSEIEKQAQNLYELGLFFVRLKVKEHSASRIPWNSESLDQITENPP
jgi:hypothetical protein